MKQNLTEHPITPLQLGMLVFMVVIGVSSLEVPSITTHAARQDAWISLLATQLFGLLAVWLYTALLKKSDGQNWIPLLRSVFHPWAGTLIGILYTLYSFLLSFTLIFYTSVFLTTYVLPETPLMTIQALLIAVLGFGMYMGLYTIARGSEIIFPWVLALMSILFIFSLPDVKPSNLLPVLGDGIQPVIQGSFETFGIPNLELFLFLNMAQLVQHRKRAANMMFGGMIFGNVCILIITVLTIVVLGSGAAGASVFAGFELARRIHIGEVFQRIEVVVGGFWILSIFFNIAVCYYSVLNNMKETLKLADYRFLIVPVSLLLMMFALSQYPSVIYYKYFVSEAWYAFHIVIGIFIPLAVLLTLQFKAKKQRSR